jgi:hypothetical protein
MEGSRSRPRSKEPTVPLRVGCSITMAYRLVVGDLLIRKVLEDCADGLSVLQICSGSPRLGVIGHSFGGITALFLAALDTRVAFACTSGAVGSLRQKLASGTGLEMSLVIPGFPATVRWFFFRSAGGLAQSAFEQGGQSLGRQDVPNWQSPIVSS